MSDLTSFIERNNISESELAKARNYTLSAIKAYNLREARKASNMTQKEVAEIIGVSQNRISRIENGDMNAMSIDSLRKYISALGGQLSLIADLPSGKVTLV